MGNRPLADLPGVENISLPILRQVLLALGQLVKLAVRAFVVTLAEPEEIPHFLRGQTPITAGFLLVASSGAFITRSADLGDLRRSIRRRAREPG